MGQMGIDSQLCLCTPHVGMTRPQLNVYTWVPTRNDRITLLT